MAPPAPASDRNLIFAVLALQIGLVARDDLLAGMHAWATQKHRPLGELLVERAALGESHRLLLEALIDAQVEKHGSVSSVAREALTTVDDPDVRSSLDLLIPPLPTQVTSDYRPAPSPPPSAQVRYRVLRPHAKGGLGEVFVAEDTELHREIALKEIQIEHADRPASRARFLLEAEVTGQLEHPGIVPVYGMGRYPDGRPFYAMRFIKGDDLRAAVKRFHAGKGRFDTVEFRQLLGRFVHVCNAVAYAHSRGVLHRDLKPANVMLGKFGETLVVDWGLAKLVGTRSVSDGSGTDEPTLTHTSAAAVETVAGAAVGTPAFMSPEQAAGHLDQLGPATDVYSLGATLYAVLTDRAPVETGDAADRLEKVRKGDWPSPRQVNPAVPAALDAVCRKAMALSPADRYQTVLSVAGDVEHWLADEPVSAYREPWPTRARRWARKNPGKVAALAAAVLVGLLGLGAGSLVLGHKNRQLAELAQKEGEAKERAEVRLGQVEKANEILGSIFKDLDPNAEEKEGKSLRVLLGEKLDKATAALDGEAIGDVLTMARMQSTLGESQLALGYPDKALRLLEKALATRAAVLGDHAPDTITTQNNVAAVWHALGKPETAIALLEKAVAASRSGLGEDHLETLKSRNNLAATLQAGGRLPEAVALLEQTLKAFQATVGATHPEALGCQSNLAAAYEASGQAAKAIPLYEEALEGFRSRLGVDHPNTLVCQSNLAMAHEALGQPNKAIPLHESALKANKVKLGADHQNTLICQNNLAMALYASGEIDKAILLHAQTLAARRAKLGDGHPDTLNSQNNLAGAYVATKQMAKAIDLYERTLKAREVVCGVTHPDTLTSRANLGRVYLIAGQPAKAIPILEETLKARRATLGDHNPKTLGSWNVLITTWEQTGQHARQEALLLDFLTSLRTKFPAGDALVTGALAQLGQCQLHLKKYAEAESALKECLAAREKKEPGDWTTFNTRSMLGQALLAQKKYSEAEPLLLGGYTGLKERQDKVPAPIRRTRLEEALRRLVQLYDDTGKKDDAAKWRKELAALQPPEKPKP